MTLQSDFHGKMIEAIDWLLKRSESQDINFEAFLRKLEDFDEHIAEMERKLEMNQTKSPKAKLGSGPPIQVQ